MLEQNRSKPNVFGSGLLGIAGYSVDPSTPGLTFGTYSHVLPPLQDDAARRMDELFDEESLTG